ncbi:MAG: response regulator transcription factor [Patescibacteria group bacterium]
MIRTIVVEDEMLVRVGLKATIDWDHLGLELVGEAGNGEEGWQLYQAQRPDLVLTDIRMPLLDGLGLIERIRETGGRTEIVILTYYKDFEYLKEAMRLGVSDYVIKVNMSPEELHSVLERVVQRIIGRIGRDQEQERLAYEARFSTAVKRRRFLKGLMLGEFAAVPEEELLSAWAGHGLAKAEMLSTLLISLDRYPRLRRELGDRQAKSLVETLLTLMEEALPGTPEVHLLVLGDDQIGAVLFGWGGRREHREEVLRVAGVLRTAMASFTRHSATIGIGGPVSSPRDLASAFIQSLRGVKERFYQGGNRIFQIEDPPPHVPGPPWPLVEETGLKAMIGQGCAANSRAFMAGFVRRARAERYGEEHLRQLFARLFVVVDQAASEEGLEPGDPLQNGACSWLDLIAGCDTLDELAEEWLRYASMVQHAIEEAKGYRKFNPLVQRAMRHVADHLGEDLRLRDMAEEMNVSAGYLSQLFSEETGEHFSDFVNRLRTERACRYLRSTRLPASEIGHLVGFNDPKYFYRVFKEFTGRTPAGYRQAALEAGDDLEQEHED